MRLWNVYFLSPTIFVSPKLNVAFTQASYINGIYITCDQKYVSAVYMKTSFPSIILC